jgi:putative transposase
MNTYKCHRFPPDIISYAVWLYYRFNLSHRRCAGPFRSMASTTTCGEPSTKRACPTKCFGYGEVVDVFLQAKRDGAAAKRFFKRLLRSHGDEPRKIVTDKLRSYGVAHREIIPESIHVTDQYANNRAEQSHEPTSVRERGMRGPASRRFKSLKQAQRFLGAHAAVSNLFNLGRHKVGSQHYRDLRISAFSEWSRAVD